MKRQIVLTLLLLSMVAIIFASAVENQTMNRPAYAKNLIKIKLKPEAILRSALPQGLYAETANFGINELDQLMSVNGGSAVIRAHIRPKDLEWEAQTGFDRWFLIRLDGSTSAEDALASFRNNRYIEDACYEYIAYPMAVPNDTYYNRNWGHNNTGQLPKYQSGGHTGSGVGTVGFDARMELAWDQIQGYGSPDIIIAIIDTGVDTSHPDLRLVTGYDFGNNDSNPMDDSADPGHGTSCSGIAAGKANNNLGVTGAAGGCSVMPLKVADSVGVMYFTAINNAITYAANNGAHVISLSLGVEEGTQEGSSPSTDSALNYAYNQGVVIFAATANSNASTIAYPANHSKVISVGAASPTGQRKSTTSSDGESWWGSNYGVNTQDNKNSVDIMGPTILPATYLNSNYTLYFNGTSCATPYVAGVAALLLSKNPSLTPAQIRSIMTSTATDMTYDGGAGWDRYTGYGLVNANAALLQVPMPVSCEIISPSHNDTFAAGSVIQIQVNASTCSGTISKVEFYIDDQLKHTDYSSPYQWNWDTTAYALGAHTIKAIATSSFSFTAESIISITLYPDADEGFESADFSAFAWENTSDTPWTVQSPIKFSGTYAAQTGNPALNASTALSINLNVTSQGYISFFRKVSVNPSNNYFRFYVDDQLEGTWNGEQDWAMQSYQVSPGFHSFRWEYTKGNNSSYGSNAAWLDHIVFPPYHSLPAPQAFQAVSGDELAYLDWQNAGIVVTNYHIYRDDAYLASTTNQYYLDEGLTNGNTYKYHVIANYGDVPSDPSQSVYVTPNFISSVVLGDGTETPTVTAAGPINVFYQSRHGQSVYTKAELNAAGIFGPINITSLGFNVLTLPTVSMQNFVVRMKHTNAKNVASWVNNSGLITCFSQSAYQPGTTGWNLYQLSQPFTWNGEDNILVDTAFGINDSYTSSGVVQTTTMVSGYRHAFNRTANQTDVFTGGGAINSRPNLKLSFARIPTPPQIDVSVSSLSFGPIPANIGIVQSFSISNDGDTALQGSISTPEGYTVSLHDAKQSGAPKNTLNYEVAGSSSATFDLEFKPVAAISYTGNLVITHNAEGASKTISLSGSGVLPAQIPFAEGFEAVPEDWNLANHNQPNTWAMGSATKHTGSASLYISNDGGASNSYTTNAPSIVHAWRYISIPADTENWKLRFACKGNGESGSELMDCLSVYLVDASEVPKAGVLPAASMLGTGYRMNASWQQISLDIPDNVASQDKLLIFTWQNDASGGAQPPAAIDDIRIVTGTQSDAAIIIDNTVSITPPAVTDPSDNVINPSIEISGLSESEGFAIVTTGYSSVNSPYASAGMDITISGINLAGATLTIHHGLGFIPLQISFKIGTEGAWFVVNKEDTWTQNTVTITIPDAKANGDFSVTFPKDQESTLPVVLSSFTATLNAKNTVLLKWTTQSESNCIGYHILRNTADELETAHDLQILIEATNTSQLQSYEFADEDVLESGTFYYWLMSADFDGGVYYYGPISITLESQPNLPPELVLETRLLNAYPNPFNPSTRISYSLLNPGKVVIELYNMRGQKVREFQNNHEHPGYYSIIWDGKDEKGSLVSSGLYFYRMSSGKYTEMKKLVLAK